ERTNRALTVLACCAAASIEVRNQALSPWRTWVRLATIAATRDESKIQNVKVKATNGQSLSDACSTHGHRGSEPAPYSGGRRSAMDRGPLHLHRSGSNLECLTPRGQTMGTLKARDMHILMALSRRLSFAH